MASTFAGLNLFNSGPHRFTMQPRGRLIAPPLAPPSYPTASTDLDVAELNITQTGRLVATSESALWTLIDAIISQVELPRTGTLIDHSGRSWPTMTLHRFTPKGPIDRGRTFSLAYEARYLRL